MARSRSVWHNRCMPSPPRRNWWWWRVRGTRKFLLHQPRSVIAPRRTGRRSSASSKSMRQRILIPAAQPALAADRLRRARSLLFERLLPARSRRLNAGRWAAFLSAYTLLTVTGIFLKDRLHRPRGFKRVVRVASASRLNQFCELLTVDLGHSAHVQKIPVTVSAGTEASVTWMNQHFYPDSLG